MTSSAPMPQPVYYGMQPLHFQQQHQADAQAPPFMGGQVHGGYHHPFPVPHPYPLPPMMMNGPGGFTISHDEVMLLQQLKYQIEWYFSPKNLMNDKYLLSQLNATEHLGAVSVETICNFPKIRELVRNFYTTRIGMVVTGPAPAAPPHLIQTALRLEFSATATSRPEIVTLSDDGLWISPTSKHVVPGQNRQSSNVTVNTSCQSNVSNEHSNSYDKKDGQRPPSSLGRSPSGDTGGDSHITATPLTMINGNINGNVISGDENNEGGTPTSGGSSEEGGGASAVPTVSTGLSTAGTSSSPSSPSSQASSVGVRTYPLPQRNVVIIRDIPNEAKLEDVIAAFSTASIQPKSARPDVGNTWYITFQSEAHAVSALSHANDKTIVGAPIRGRLKSENSSAPTVKSTVASSSTLTNGHPSPISLLPPSLQAAENDDSVVASVSSSVRSATTTATAGVALHPSVHLMQNHYPLYPPMPQPPMAGMPLPFPMPSHGYGFMSPQQIYAMQYFTPHLSYQGMQQRYVGAQHHHPSHRNGHQNQNSSRQHKRFPGPQGSSRTSQQHNQLRQSQLRGSNQSLSSATDHSQLDGSQRHASTLTPPAQVFVKNDPSKNKERETIEGSSNRFRQHFRVSNDSLPDQLRPRPPTQNKKKKPGNKIAQTTTSTSKPCGNSSNRDVDNMSVGSRNSRRSNSNNRKKIVEQTKQKVSQQTNKKNFHCGGLNERTKSGNAKNGQSKNSDGTGKKTLKSDKKRNEASRSEIEVVPKRNEKPVINVADFPALGGETTAEGKPPRQTNGPRATGYVQALLKAPSVAAPSSDTEKCVSTDT